MEQRTTEWYTARKGRITGSAVGAILGLSKFATPDDVMRRMVREYHNQPSEFTGNIATEYGTLNEPNALADYEIETGNSVVEVGFIQVNEWLGASPDGLVGDKGLIEIKCPYGLRHGGEFKSIDDQQHYYAQIQIQLLCTEREWCDFYQWSAYGSKLERVNFNPAWIEENIPKLKAFYEKYLIEREEEKAWRYIDGGELVHNYKLAVARMEVAKQELDDAKDALFDAVGDDGGQIGDLKITKVERKGSISYAKAIKDLAPGADLSQYEGKPTSYWKIS